MRDPGHIEDKRIAAVGRQSPGQLSQLLQAIAEFQPPRDLHDDVPVDSSCVEN